ncbi:MAG TPA: polysaccharide deacetylase family protein [Segetibacter sp.]|jgi:hypothetical protein
MGSGTVAIYCNRITSRIQYIFSTLLPAIGIANFNFFSSKTAFNNASAVRINYSTERQNSEEIFIRAGNLLFEDAVEEQVIQCFPFKETKAFFNTPDSDFPFDIFAASFYLISRYEEYLPHKQDLYGRYAHENCLAFKESFLKDPAINIWLQYFLQVLQQKHPGLQCTQEKFRFLPTYDIDIAWSYLDKGLLRNTGGAIRSLLKGQWEMIRERVQVLTGNQQDPFDCYEWLNQLHGQHQLKPVYFFLVARQNKDYDKNILPAKREMQQLIQQHFSSYNAGIHPSWQSGDKPELLQKEINLLANISGQAIQKSRQHYIRFNLPYTYRQSLQAGITEDYSMGYGSINGFRASYCLPYKWYDLMREETTSLTLFPFCFMDANSYYEQQYSCNEALEEMNYYFKTVKAVNGLLITIWHNHFLGTDRKFAGWREVYEAAIGKMTA